MQIDPPKKTKPIEKMLIREEFICIHFLYARENFSKNIAVRWIKKPRPEPQDRNHFSGYRRRWNGFASA
jgi:hypothetical protein